MFSFAAIRALLGGLPASVKVGIAALVVVGVLQVRHAVEVRGLRKQIDAAQRATEQEKSAKAAIQVQLADVIANRNTLQARIVEQNRAIDIMRDQNSKLESAAALRAVRVLRDGEAASRDIRAGRVNVAPGHEAMNTWFRERFAR